MITLMAILCLAIGFFNSFLSKDIPLLINNIWPKNYFQVKVEVLYLFIFIIVILASIKLAKSIKSQKYKRNLTSSRKLMISSINHQIINITNNIFGMMQLVQITKLDDSQKKYFEHMYFSMKTLILTLNNIIFLTKYEINDRPILNRSFNIVNIALLELKAFELEAQNKNIELIFSADDNLPKFLKGDREKLRHVVANILDNAIKFTSNGKVSLVISKLFEDDHDLLVKFTISDTGVGISEEDSRKFYQFSFSNQFFKKNNYSGIGLLVSKRIIELCGGSMWWKSIPDLGSVFYFKMPFQK